MSCPWYVLSWYHFRNTINYSPYQHCIWLVFHFLYWLWLHFNHTRSFRFFSTNGKLFQNQLSLLQNQRIFIGFTLQCYNVLVYTSTDWTVGEDMFKKLEVLKVKEWVWFDVVWKRERAARKSRVGCKQKKKAKRGTLRYNFTNINICATIFFGLEKLNNATLYIEELD